MPSGVLAFPEIAVVYARFIALTALSADLGGRLLLYSGLDRDGIAVVMAANVAGAASLGLESDAGRAKEALRAGVCDFLVNSLDEALRILKNEIRSRRPVSVVLAGDARANTAQMIERGVQPDILASPIREFIDRGAQPLPVGAGSDDLLPVAWKISGNMPRQLAALDAFAAKSLRGNDAGVAARVRWIEASPKYLGRAFAGQRFLRMTEAEADSFLAAAKTAVGTGAIAVAVSISRGGETTEITR